jgi:glycosyltransferase involved in cell wall biosynthesis
MILKEKKLNILFMSPFPPPFYGSALSSEMCLSILLNQSNLKVNYLKLNTVQSISEIGHFSIYKIYHFLTVIFKLIPYLFKKHEIIYFVPATAGFALFRDAILFKIIKLFKKGKLIIHLRSRFLEVDFKNNFKLYFIKTFFQCDQVIILGKSLIENTKGYLELSKIIILPNALPETIKDEDFNKFLIRRKSTEKLNLLFLSNMLVEKGWIKVLESINLLKLRNPKVDFTCHFVGSWSNKNDELFFFKYLETQKLGSHVVYHGNLTGKNKLSILEITDIMIFPTEYKLETFGRVIVEAMEYGIPVISNNLVEIPTIISNGKTGFITKINSSEEIYKYIIKLLDDNLRLEFSYNARQRFLERYTLKVFEQRFLKLFVYP